MGGHNKKMLTEEEDKFGNGAGIELADIYGSSNDKIEKDLNKSFNPMAKKAKGDSLSTKKDQSVNKLPAGWEMTTDEQGRPYYFNSITEETSWDRPKVPMAKKAKGSSTSSADGESSAELPAGWEMTTDEQDRPYYFNNITEETSWDRPKV